MILDAIFVELRQHRILQGAYLRVAPGSVCGLFGRNGTGKSTLLKVAAGQISPASGLTIIDGERLYRRALRRRFRMIAYLPQDSMLPRDMAVRRLIQSFPIEPVEDPKIGEIKEKRVDELSVGMRRYLEIRLLMSLNRRYVLLDEPFTGVEPIMIERIADLIVTAARTGSGILLTDHYQHYAVPFVDDAYVMVSKQCRRLDPSRDRRAQLYEHG